MMTVVEETQTGLQRDGKQLYRRVYLATGKSDALPTDGAPGSMALVRDGDVAQLYVLFSDGVWGRI